MSSEQVCYTIINNPIETETSNEQQLKHDIGKLVECSSCSHTFITVLREYGNTST